MTQKSNVETLALTKGARCPTCQSPTSPKYRPFCSKRCADLDLGAWLNEGYRIESEEESDLDEYDPG